MDSNNTTALRKCPNHICIALAQPVGSSIHKHPCYDQQLALRKIDTSSTSTSDNEDSESEEEEKLVGMCICMRFHCVINTIN